MAQKKVTQTQKPTKEIDRKRRTSSRLKDEAPYSQKLFVIFSEGSEAIKTTARITIDAWLDMVKAEKGGAR